MKRTIPALVGAAVEAVPDKVWLSSEDGEVTYAQAFRRILRAAAGLRAAGVGRGDRVLVTAANRAEYVVAWLALMEVGAVQIPVNPESSEPELAGFLSQASPKVVVTDQAHADVVGRAASGAGSGAGIVDVVEVLGAAPDEHRPAQVEPEDVAVMIPTSGTTGRSKLVMQTHLAYVMAAEGFPWWLGLSAEDRLMTSLPLFHINAPCYSVLGSLAARAGVVLLPRFSASTFLDTARRFGATEFNAIGAMVEILMRQPPRPDDADTPLRLCYTGPAPDRERQEEIERRFGFQIVSGYALSETPYGMVWPRGARPYGTLGVPRQHPELGHVNDARVRDGDREVADGEVGELELNNPAVMRGYYEMPEETAAVLADGWLRTGDLVRRNPDGTYTFVGRKKEVIRRRGENLSPAEVEAVLERHPTVSLAAVIGVPSELSEDDVKAFVVPAAGRPVDVEELHRFAGEHLARFKVPRYFEIVDALPHTPTGRVVKHELPVERTAEEVDMEDPTRGESGGREWLRTSIGSATPDSITVAGRSLPDELMGRVSFTQLAYLLLTKQEPTASQTVLLDAVLVSLADHGLTPSALAARLTYTGAPEAVQGAVAAGLLGAGSVLLGPAGDTAEFLARALAGHGGEVVSAELLDGIAGEAVAARRREGRRIPGLGHPLHKEEDPRVPRLYQLAEELDLLGPHLRLLRAVARRYEQEAGRALPINGAGAAGAALVDLGLPPGAVRGFVLIARTAGLVAHLAEEAEAPLGRALWDEVERRAAGAAGERAEGDG